MLISRGLARARMAQGERPGAVAAWLPVLADGVVTAAILAVGFRMAQPWLTGLDLTPLTLGLALFVVLYIPFHAVLVVSSMWAVRSRWVDPGEDAPKDAATGAVPKDDRLPDA